MKHPNDMIQMDILGPFFIHQLMDENEHHRKLKRYDCSKKAASKCFETERSIDVQHVCEEWIMVNGKPKKIMHDNGKQITSKNLLPSSEEHNNIKDKPIPHSSPQLQGKVGAYNKIVKNQFISVEDISSIDEWNLR